MRCFVERSEAKYKWGFYIKAVTRYTLLADINKFASEASIIQVNFIFYQDHHKFQPNIENLFSLFQ